MKYLIEIDCNNAAFEEDPSDEIFAILERLRRRTARNGLEDEAPLLDTNGNRVGTARLVKEDRDLETYREIPTLDEEDV